MFLVVVAKFFLKTFAQGRGKNTNLLKTVRKGLGIDPETIFELEQEFHRPVRRAEREMRNAFLDRFFRHKERRRETTDKLMGCGLFGNGLEAGGAEKTGVAKLVSDAIQLPLGGQTSIDGDYENVTAWFKKLRL